MSNFLINNDKCASFISQNLILSVYFSSYHINNLLHHFILSLFPLKYIHSMKCHQLFSFFNITGADPTMVDSYFVLHHKKGLAKACKFD